jgi:hypothetical protein
MIRIGLILQSRNIKYVDSWPLTLGGVADQLHFRRRGWPLTLQEVRLATHTSGGEERLTTYSSEGESDHLHFRR